MRKKYSTDLTNKQWEEIKPLLVGMKNRKCFKRYLINAALYLVDSGCKWRQLPHDFPPAFTVHSFYRRVRLSGLWTKFFWLRCRKRNKRQIAPDNLDCNTNMIQKLVYYRRLSKNYEYSMPSALAIVKLLIFILYLIVYEHTF